MRLTTPRAVDNFICAPGRKHSSRKRVSGCRLSISKGIITSNRFSGVGRGPVRRRVRFTPIGNGGLIFGTAQVISGMGHIKVTRFSIVARSWAVFGVVYI